MFKYILHYAPAKILPGLINFIGLTIYARIFTQEEYGRYSYVFATLGLIQSILFPWIRMSVARFYQKYNKQGKESEYENFTMFIFLIVSIALIIGWMFFLSFFYIDPKLKTLYILGLFVILSQSLFEQLMSLARAKLQSNIFLFSMVSKAVLKILLVLILVLLFNLNEKALLIGIIISHMFPIYIYMKKFFNYDIKYMKLNKSFIKETFHYGFPLTFTFLLTFIINSSDRILIKYFLDDKSVGLYSIPYEFTTFTLTNVFMVFGMAFFPVIVRELEHIGLNQAKKRVLQYSSILLTFTIPTTMFMYMLAPEIAGLFLGDNYNSPEAIRIIQLISIAAFFGGLKAYFFDYAFQLGKNTYKQIIPVVIAAFINIISNIILLPILGVIGAVIGTLLAYIIGIFVSVVIGRKLFPMRVPLKHLSKILFINLILFIVLFNLPPLENSWIQLFTGVLVGGLTYIFLMFAFNIINVRKMFIGKIKN